VDAPEAWRKGPLLRHRDPSDRIYGSVSLIIGLAGLLVLGATMLSAAGVADAAGQPRLVHPLNEGGIDVGGQFVTPNGGLASASVTFAIPSISCTSSDVAHGAELADGVFTENLRTYALIAESCTSSGPKYSFLVGTDTEELTDPGVEPGDVVVTSLFESGTSTWAEIHDLTLGAYWSASNSVDQGDTSVFLGTYNGTVPIPTFGKIKYSSATVNGDDLGFDILTTYNTVNGSELLIKTSTVTTTRAGSSFSEKFKHAS
jgi:hypothetical protein